ncbi:bifunctional diaminohydroxyphosphoribosylaminopyrimidine deaminase/5-amino-6-(5-phosphoribosylamino)uracil reductase RibD [bacterium]|nr:bifunctional diaminohydroxyphosphoribosylaminopyrimidine deaminase/5-amino-6-(5-phosphoribosylamino)uracil reductase RibD [bacterium]
MIKITTFENLNHEQYMSRCIELAKRGESEVFSNPMVGAVIVHGDQIIGEGYHEKYGEAHAEVNAIKSVEDCTMLKESTMYVSLEPCSHFGKTPPCANKIIDCRIPKVIIGQMDPNPLVAGKGIQLLKDAGIIVKQGILEEECKQLNLKFNKLHTKKLPFISLKWAQTNDGFMGRLESDFGTTRISSKSSDIRVHQLRANHNAIMIGANTANRDNPSLNVRLWKGRNPIKVILSPQGSVSLDLNLYKSGKTIVFSYHDLKISGNVECIKLESGGNFIENALHYLAKMGLHSVLIEGGAQILKECITLGLWDEIHVIQSQSDWNRGIQAPKVSLKANIEEKSGSDTWFTYSRHE